MRVLLVTAPYTFNQTHQSYMVHTVSGVSPPVGLLYVASSLRTARHTVRVIDGAFHSKDQILDAISEFHPEVVGIGFVAHLWPISRRLIDEIKRRQPDVFIIAGGPGPNTLGKRCLEESPALDAIVLQEGEITAVKILDRLERKLPLSGVGGIIFRKANGCVESNSEQDLILDLDLIPYPAFDLINLRHYKPPFFYRLFPVQPVFSSRGCPMACIFCSRILGDRVRYRSPSNVVKEIEYGLRVWGTQEFRFDDENFMLKSSRVRDLCELLLARNICMPWSAAGRVDSVDMDLLRLMKKAGCWRIFYGIESGVQKNLDLLQKKTTLEQVTRAIRMTHRTGIQSHSLFILGIPDETPEEARETIRFACHLNSYYVEFFPLTPFPGTKIAEIAKHFGTVEPDLEKYNMHTITFVPFTMTKEELESLRREAYLRYCLRLRFIFLRLQHLRFRGDLAGLRKGIAFIGLLFLKEIRDSGLWRTLRHFRR